MRLHGVTEPEDYISKAMQGKNTQKLTPVKAENRTDEVSYCTANVDDQSIHNCGSQCHTAVVTISEEKTRGH